MGDPDFGAMKYNGIDAWDSRVEFDFPHRHSRAFAVHVWACATGPSAAQRIRFRQLQARYGALWEDIGPRIVAAHPTLASVEALNNSTSEHVGVHLGECSEESVELIYTLDLPDEDGRAYFVPLEGWEVGSIVVAN